MIVGPGSRPRLAPRARLRLDRQTGQTVLLYPERGLVLNTIGQAVLELCAADRTVEDVVAVLGERYAADPAQVRAEVLTFLQQLADRGLLEERSP
ncbi:MAG TPA: pyrroloquinoline quinone biosynthesis peptide chaperone PqqD [Polyangia bacterium]|jgi:coenzyme PQQ biosynthesis protein PqqD|nr:pyrroloquinoline quinone biosynthesis peptide chaperone PqqD [Polyangia bacterium]